MARTHAYVRIIYKVAPNIVTALTITMALGGLSKLSYTNQGAH
jgi:predicted cobalt transporter CbtA